MKTKTHNRRRIVGLMSGTSADGLDLAAVDIRHDDDGPIFKLRAAVTAPYPRSLRRAIMSVMDSGECAFEILVRLQYAWSAFAAEQVQTFLHRSRIPRRSIDALASHGQTVAHYSTAKREYGFATRGTMQIGDPSVLAVQTGLVTIGDFRWADIAAGGTGAPLSGYYHHLMFSRLLRGGRRSLPLAVLNLGGIANLSVAWVQRNRLEITAFDTGPANCLSDLLVQRWETRNMDRDGRWAAGGIVSAEALGRMTRHPYFRKPPPKSCGKEEFGTPFLLRYFPRAPRKGQETRDRLATMNELVAHGVKSGLGFLGPVGGVIVVGGGRKNRDLMSRIGRAVSPLPLVSCEALGVPGDFVEAIGFALLANETLSGRPGNPGGATGARPVPLGKICLPEGAGAARCLRDIAGGADTVK